MFLHSPSMGVILDTFKDYPEKAAENVNQRHFAHLRGHENHMRFGGYCIKVYRKRICQLIPRKSFHSLATSRNPMAFEIHIIKVYF